MTGRVEHDDKTIRAALVDHLRTRYPGARLVQEWSVGQSRVDVAMIVGFELHGYEIKSPRDSLARLPQQVRDYSAVFNRVTLVTDWKHATRARNIVPAWWGLWKIETWHDGALRFDEDAGARNHCFNADALCWLLWHREMRALMMRRCLDWRAARSKYHMAIALADKVPALELQQAVIGFLHARTDWKDTNDGARGSRWV